jgi:hypothetical protein
MSILDGIPYRILNSQYARVATSGSEFLLMLGDYYAISAVVVHASASGLSVSAPIAIDDHRPLGYGRAFDVTWDGAYYEVAWNGNDYDDWLRLWRLDRSGNVLQKLFTTASTPDAPSVAANDAGEVAIGISEDAPPSDLSRARIYFGSELQPVPLVLATPTNVVSHLSGQSARLQWEGNAPGFVVEKFFVLPQIGPDFWQLIEGLSGDVHETTVDDSHPGDVYRIRANGPDGVSPDGAVTTIHSEPRTRSVRP